MGIYNSFPLLVADSHGFQKGDFWALTTHNMKHYPSHLGPKHKAISVSVFGGIFPLPLLRTFSSCAVFVGPSHTLPLCLSSWFLVTAFDCALNHLPPTDDTFLCSPQPSPSVPTTRLSPPFSSIVFPSVALGLLEGFLGKMGSQR